MFITQQAKIETLLFPLPWREHLRQSQKKVQCFPKQLTCISYEFVSYEILGTWMFYHCSDCQDELHTQHCQKGHPNDSNMPTTFPYGSLQLSLLSLGLVLGELPLSQRPLPSSEACPSGGSGKALGLISWAGYFLSTSNSSMELLKPKCTPYPAESSIKWLRSREQAQSFCAPKMQALEFCRAGLWQGKVKTSKHW